MSYQITVVPASTSAGKATIRNLLSNDSIHAVQGIYRDVSKAPAEFSDHPKFTALTGDVSSGEAIDFTGSDAVLYVPPPPQDASRLDEYAVRAATHIKEAISKASVKRLVLISSMGAQFDREIGILRLNHLSDKVLMKAAPEVVIVKPGYFQDNWAHVFETIQQNPPVIYSTIGPKDHQIPMVSVPDVGKVCAEKLVQVGEPLATSPYYFDLFGPQNYSAEDVRAAVEEVTGKNVAIEVIPQDQLAAFYALSVHESHVAGMVDMTTAALPGGIMVGDFAGNELTVHGEEDLVSTLRRLSEGH